MRRNPLVIKNTSSQHKISSKIDPFGTEKGQTRMKNMKMFSSRAYLPLEQSMDYLSFKRHPNPIKTDLKRAVAKLVSVLVPKSYGDSLSSPTQPCV